MCEKIYKYSLENYKINVYIYIGICLEKNIDIYI